MPVAVAVLIGGDSPPGDTLICPDAIDTTAARQLAAKLFERHPAVDR